MKQLERMSVTVAIDEVNTKTISGVSQHCATERRLLGSKEQPTCERSMRVTSQRFERLKSQKEIWGVVALMASTDKADNRNICQVCSKPGRIAPDYWKLKPQSTRGCARCGMKNHNTEDVLGSGNNMPGSFQGN